MKEEDMSEKTRPCSNCAGTGRKIDYSSVMSTVALGGINMRGSVTSTCHTCHGTGKVS